jgi:hypothetical protein
MPSLPTVVAPWQPGWQPGWRRAVTGAPDRFLTGMATVAAARGSQRRASGGRVPDMSSELRAGGSGSRGAEGAGGGWQRSLLGWRALSVLFLLAMGGIHLYLVFHGVGGVLGALFVLNAVGALVLAIAMVVLRGRFLLVASVLSLLFMLGTLLALVLALTIGLFGIRESLDFQLVPTTLVVESIGTIVLAVTTALVFQLRRAI